MNPLIGFIGNNMMSEYHAERDYDRELNMMAVQNRLNASNATNAPMQQVQGMRMAGLNPALSQSLGSAPVQSVSKGSAGKAETVPMSMSDMLLDAQIQNINAQTDLIHAQANSEAERPENIKSDTSLKVAQTLNTGANTEKVNEEAQNIRNINDTFTAENETLAKSGPTMAQKWKSEKWYNNLSANTRAMIDGIANGSIKLSVGAMNAINKTINTQKNLSEADNKMIRNAFDNAIIESQFNDNEVMKAIQKEPWYKKENLRLTNAKIAEDTKRVKAEIEKILAEKPYWEINAKNQSSIIGYEADKMKAEQPYYSTNAKNQSDLLSHETEMKRMLNKSFEAGDLDYLKSQGEYGAWFEKYAEGLFEKVLPMIKNVNTNNNTINTGNTSKSNKSNNNSKPTNIKGSKPPNKIRKTSYYSDGVSNFRFS